MSAAPKKNAGGQSPPADLYRAQPKSFYQFRLAYIRPGSGSLPVINIGPGPLSPRGERPPGVSISMSRGPNLNNTHRPHWHARLTCLTHRPQQHGPPAWPNSVASLKKQSARAGTALAGSAHRGPVTINRPRPTAKNVESPPSLQLGDEKPGWRLLKSNTLDGYSSCRFGPPKGR